MNIQEIQILTKLYADNIHAVLWSVRWSIFSDADIQPIAMIFYGGFTMLRNLSIRLLIKVYINQEIKQLLLLI